MCDGQRISEQPSSHSCACGGHGGHSGHGGAGRVVDAATELILPAVIFPSPRVLDVAGEQALRQLTRRHHHLLAAGPLAPLFPADPESFSHLLGKIADFFVEACGGPALYTEQQGRGCMRTRHFPITVDERAREIWLEALYQAMVLEAFPVQLREEYWTWLEAFSVRMINRRTMKAQPERIPYALAHSRFGQPAETTGIAATD